MCANQKESIYCLLTGEWGTYGLHRILDMPFSKSKVCYLDGVVVDLRHGLYYTM